MNAALPADGQSPLQVQALNHLISMLERSFLQKSSLTLSSPVRGPTRQLDPKLLRISGLHDMPFSVCQDGAHFAFVTAVITQAIRLTIPDKIVEGSALEGGQGGSSWLPAQL